MSIPLSGTLLDVSAPLQGVSQPSLVVLGVDDDTARNNYLTELAHVSIAACNVSNDAHLSASFSLARRRSAACPWNP